MAQIDAGSVYFDFDYAGVLKITDEHGTRPPLPVRSVAAIFASTRPGAYVPPGPPHDAHKDSHNAR